MADKPTFLSEVVAGRAVRSDMDDWIAAWHEGRTGVELHEFLGLTQDQYSRVVQQPSTIDEVLTSMGWQSPDVTDTGLFRILHDREGDTQRAAFQNSTQTKIGDMSISISVTAPEGLDYRNVKVVNDLFRATMRRLVDVGCIVEIQIGPDGDWRKDEPAAIDRILTLRGDVRG